EQTNNVDALLGMSSISRFRGNSNAALEYLARAKDLLADSPDQNYKFAVAATSLNLHEDAISALKKSIAAQPDEPSYYLVLGIVQLRLRRPDLDDAEESFRECLKSQPGNAQAQLHLGYVLLKKKHYPEAQTWLEKTVQKQNGPPEAFYYLGLIAQEV